MYNRNEVSLDTSWANAFPDGNIVTQALSVLTQIQEVQKSSGLSFEQLLERMQALVNPQSTPEEEIAVKPAGMPTHVDFTAKPKQAKLVVSVVDPETKPKRKPRTIPKSIERFSYHHWLQACLKWMKLDNSYNALTDHKTIPGNIRKAASELHVFGAHHLTINQYIDPDQYVEHIARYFDEQFQGASITINALAKYAADALPSYRTKQARGLIAYEPEIKPTVKQDQPAPNANGSGNMLTSIMLGLNKNQS